METITIVYISFPELVFRPSDGHKIRGYFSTWWQDRSDLLHNHTPEGNSIYRYPLVQYKVVRKIPTIVGIGKGAQLLIEMFLNIEELVIQGETIPLLNKTIRSKKVETGLCKKEQLYQFISPWMALNQENFQKWKESDQEGRTHILKGILLSNVLAFFKAIGVWLEDRITIDQLDLSVIKTNFKNQEMLAFKGRFSSNVLLPDLVGLGKSTSRGYGNIQNIT